MGEPGSHIRSRDSSFIRPWGGRQQHYPSEYKVPALRSLSSGGKRDENRDTLKQHTHTAAAFGIR